ncbi:alpha-mannosidase [Clostridiales bacterium COT073_COT-073]|nr:alpha-mannosidase [Clostridiales bacterium COT073_COT-073]
MFTEQRIEEIINQLSMLRYPQKTKILGWKMQKRDQESKPSGDESRDDWEVVSEGYVWGGHLQYAVFAAKVEIPAGFAGKTIEFSLLTGKEEEWDATNPQFSVYINGQLRQGFDVNHHDIRLTPEAVAGESYDIFLSAYTGVQNFYLLFQPTLRTVDLGVEKLYYDLLVPYQVTCLLEPEDTLYLKQISILNQTINLLDLRKPGSPEFYQSLKQADQYLQEQIYEQPGLAEALVYCVGHTHIDIAWLWTLSVTKDKAVRSFSTVLELMRRYPEYIFMSSQPQLYQYVKENAPEIYEQIRMRIAEGRWEAEGGMFVEPDCNLASGESLVRQFLIGKTFFKEEFGRDNVILWLPDVFGYSAALPQIMDKCGIRYFMTTKISWNEYNKMPYDTFYWKGIDGTKILTHFIPTRDYVSTTRTIKTNNEHTSRFTTNYNGYIHPSQMKGAWQRYQQKDLNQEVLCSYGYGDGGGGSTPEMLETQRRLAVGIPGCPVTKLSTARQFFEQLERSIQGKKVPIWSGELYLEYHRATYTAMAKNKRYNRKGEFALTNLESYSLLARILCGLPYPEKLREHWQILLRNQFHDILPGSSIAEVYEDSDKEYQQLFAYTTDEEQWRLQAIANAVGQAVVFNGNGQMASGFAALSEPGDLQCFQKTVDGYYLVWAENVPAKGYAVISDQWLESKPVELSVEKVNTPFAEICFNEKGHICSWYDKTAERQLLQSGECANVLMAYEDKPHKYDNWNLFAYYKEKSWPVEDLLTAEVIETGPYRFALKFKWQYQDTIIEEMICFYGNSPRVDIQFITNWREDQIFLKALFPLALNTTEATYEIQYGNVKRSTAYNTSWDWARFEVCYHKWMDVAESGYGVSFLNDCKYGVSIEENVIGLSLIKSGRYPNPKADRELHQAVYSIFPHIGSWQEAAVVREAYLLNNPFIGYIPNAAARQQNSKTTSKKLSLPERYGLVEHTNGNIMVEVIKQAEKTKDIVLRLYEFENKRSKLTLRLAPLCKRIWLCDMLEEKQSLVAENTNICHLTVEPFAILTLLIEI